MATLESVSEKISPKWEESLTCCFNLRFAQKKKTHDRRRGGKLVSVPLRHFADERESRGHTVASDSCNSRVLLTISVYLLLNLPYCGLCTKLVFLERIPDVSVALLLAHVPSLIRTALR